MILGNEQDNRKLALGANDSKIAATMTIPFAIVPIAPQMIYETYDLEVDGQKQVLIAGSGDCRRTYDPFNAGALYQFLSADLPNKVQRWVHRNGLPIYSKTMSVADYDKLHKAMRTICQLHEAVATNDFSVLRKVQSVSVASMNEIMEFLGGFHLSLGGTPKTHWILTYDKIPIFGTTTPDKPTDSAIPRILVAGLASTALRESGAQPAIHNGAPWPAPALGTMGLKAYLYALLLRLITSKYKARCKLCGNQFVPDDDENKRPASQIYCPGCRESYASQAMYRNRLRSARKDVVKLGKSPEQAALDNSVNLDRLLKILSGESTI